MANPVVTITDFKKIGRLRPGSINTFSVSYSADIPATISYIVTSKMIMEATTVATTPSAGVINFSLVAPKLNRLQRFPKRMLKDIQVTFADVGEPLDITTETIALRADILNFNLSKNKVR